MTDPGLADLVGVQKVDADVTATREGTHHGSERPGGAATPADDLTQVFGVDAHLQDTATAHRTGGNLDVVGVLDDAPDQMLQRLFQHVRPRYPAHCSRTRPGRPNRPQPQCPPGRCPPGRPQPQPRCRRRSRRPSSPRWPWTWPGPTPALRP